MCIIIYKKFGKKMPDDDILRYCFNTNRDGAGFAYLTKKGPYFEKGFFEFSAFLKRIKEIPEQGAIVMHFRISSCGGVSPEMTHPFDVEQAEENPLSGFCKTLLFHNGCLRIGHDKDESDTLALARLMARWKPDLDDPAVLKDVANVTDGSRILLMHGKHVTYMGGGVEDENCWYSNGGYKPISPTRVFDFRTQGYSDDGDFYNYKSNKWLRKHGFSHLIDD